jgi:hypothetical protein
LHRRRPLSYCRPSSGPPATGRGVARLWIGPPSCRERRPSHARVIVEYRELSGCGRRRSPGTSIWTVKSLIVFWGANGVKKAGRWLHKPETRPSYRNTRFSWGK